MGTKEINWCWMHVCMLLMDQEKVKKPVRQVALFKITSILTTYFRMMRDVKKSHVRKSMKLNSFCTREG